VRNEAIPSGERRLAQKGEPGRVRITYRIFYVDDVEVERTEVRRTVLEEPVDEIVVVGAQEDFSSVPITGTVAYLSNGNAWIMRETSNGRRPLTSSGDLDGRVFDLSPDGRYLIFTRSGGTEPDAPLNSLWVVTTTVLGESPVPLGLEDLLYGEWAPDGQRLAYSTAEHTGGRPGWKALNDLGLASFRTQEGLIQIQPATEAQPLGLDVETVRLPSTEGALSWWGANYAWSPDGKYIAYARPDQIGVVDVALKLPIRLIEFPEYNTYSDWVWTSSLSWAPDSRFIVCTVHKPIGQGIADEDSPTFDIEVIAVDRSVHAGLVRNAGMWASARWSPVVDGSDSLIAYGLARSPHESERSRYDLFLMDRDGSNPRRLHPQPGETGLMAPPQIAWSPTGSQMLLLRGGNLFLLNVGSDLVRQLTGDGGASLPRWQGG
jgi:dipeptidyl aminopeptidase/acylaminoacyl peptidase